MEDKTKLTPFYSGVFEEYENDKFPLKLLAKTGTWITFKTKKELFDYFLELSNIDRKMGEVI